MKGIGIAMGVARMLVVASAEARGRHDADQGGHYSGGHGSSHRGGHYRNARTHDHYTRHRR